MAIQRFSNRIESNENYKNEISPFLIAMGEEFGYVAAHHIFSHISRTLMIPIRDILFSDYEGFTRILNQVYTEEIAERDILSRLTRFRLKERLS